MEWQATDQFGNLYVGESSAQDIGQLRPHLEMLISALRERAGESFQVTVDFREQDICGPDPEQVSHILRVPWLGTEPRESIEQPLRDMFAALFNELGMQEVRLALV